MVPRSERLNQGKLQVPRPHPCALGTEGTVRSFHSEDTPGCFQGSSSQPPELLGQPARLETEH